MYALDDVRLVHLELTTKCNAHCPQCPRNLQGSGINPLLPLAELRLDQCARIFEPAFVAQLQELYVCGDYGDAIVARDTLEVFEYLRAHNSRMRLKLHTNGSGRDATWWRRLAQSGCTVRFAIDGLEDTNHVYRRGTNWSRIQASYEAFIRAGGAAEWAFIVFKHNEHQVEEAREVARRAGFGRFVVRRSKRLVDRRSGKPKYSVRVLDESGGLEYLLEPPERAEYRLPLASVPSDSSHGEIRCRAAAQHMLYVNAEGLVLPCCWLGNLYTASSGGDRPQIWQLIERLPGQKAALSALEHSLRAVVEGPFFQDLVPNGWIAGAVVEGRLQTCTKVCGSRSLQDLQNVSYNLRR